MVKLENHEEIEEIEEIENNSEDYDWNQFSFGDIAMTINDELDDIEISQPDGFDQLKDENWHEMTTELYSKLENKAL